MSLHVSIGGVWVTSRPGAGERPWSSALSGWAVSPERTIQVDKGAGWATAYFRDFGQRAFSLGFRTVRELESDLEAALFLAQLTSMNLPHPTTGLVMLVWVEGTRQFEVQCRDAVLEVRQVRPIGGRSVSVDYLLRGGVMLPNALETVVAPSQVALIDEDGTPLISEFGARLYDE